MRIVISIVYTESWEPLADLVLPNTKKYCERHGYELVATCFPEPCTSKFGWNKISQAKNILENSLNITAVMVMDLDCLITNFNTKVEDFIPVDENGYNDDYNYDELLICSDFNGINAGVFIIVKNEYILQEIEIIGRENNFDCEQDAIVKYIAQGQIAGDVKILPHPSINSYDYNLYPEIPMQTHEQGQWEPNDFIIHFPGIGMNKRIELLKEYQNKIIL